ncbi:BnaC01g00470D [Brassica napus]|uniref:BnaC01g00470D protein n=1 Tax=Brassica napus TaxID=3708 RepID=A0A078HVZ7_BRANA|nr:BnaC01g00470D [Brassica napus]
MSSKSRSLAATSVEDPPHNKKMKQTEHTSILILSLPDDLLINCLARVSRLYYHFLSRVSKRFRSIIASPELYATRSRLNRTEKCIYLYLRFPFDPKTYWLTLSGLPSRNVANGSSGYYMEQIPCPNYLRPAQSSTLVSVGSDIYKIGGANHLHECKIWKRNYCVSVSVLDCRTHTWRQAPSMGMAHYVSKPNWIEAFDLETQTWGPVTNPRIFRLYEEDRVKGFEAKTVSLEGKLYIFGDEAAIGFLWDQYLYTATNQECRVWCAEIALERRDGDEMWGKVDCTDAQAVRDWSYCYPDTVDDLLIPNHQETREEVSHSNGKLTGIVRLVIVCYQPNRVHFFWLVYTLSLIQGCNLYTYMYLYVRACTNVRWLKNVSCDIYDLTLLIWNKVLMSSKSRSSAATSRKDPPHDKKMPATEPMSISFSSLPDDLLINCLARVSRLYYPALSCVSKNFRSIIASPEIYQTRSSLNRTEKCIYLYLSFCRDPETYWFTMRRRPSRNIANESSGYYMEMVPSPKYLHPAQSSTLVAVGSDVYKIGGGDHSTCKLSKRKCSYSFSVLDCRTHTWRQAPSMWMERDSSSTATFFDGKIYVAGGCDKRYVGYPDRVEAFDLEKQTWGFVTNPRVFDRYHKFKAARECHCVIDDVLFFWESGAFKWHDSKTRLCKEVSDVKGLPDLHDPKFCKMAMVDLGGKMGLLWNTKTSQECKIWCAEITFERRHGDEMWGKVEWFDSVLSTHVSCSSFYAVSASV